MRDQYLVEIEEGELTVERVTGKDLDGTLHVGRIVNVDSSDRPVTWKPSDVKEFLEWANREGHNVEIKDDARLRLSSSGCQVKNDRFECNRSWN